MALARIIPACMTPTGRKARKESHKKVWAGKVGYYKVETSTIDTKCFTYFIKELN